MRERGVGMALAKLSRDASQTRAEREGLDASPAARQRVRHVEEKAGVRLHRPGNVAQDHERSTLRATGAADEHGGLAVGGKRFLQGRARIEPRTVSRRTEPSTRALAR